MTEAKTFGLLLLALLAAGACGIDSGSDDAAPAPRAIATLFEPNYFEPEGVLDLPAEPVCDSCRIELGEVFELVSDEADGAMPGGLGALDRLADGRFAAVFWGAAPIYVFGADGAFDSTIGQEGSGPGEFRQIGNGLFTNGATIYVFDTGNSRLSVVDADSGEVVDEVRLNRHANVLNAAFPTDDMIVITGRQAMSDQPGYPLHILDRAGNWLLSFGSSEPYEDQGDGWKLLRYLTSAGDGTFWAAPMRELVLEQWSVEGERLRAYSGRREGFTPGEDGNFAEDGRPTSRMYGITIDDDGLLWALYSIASADWQDNAEILTAEEARARRVPMVRPLPGRRIRDAYLEVIDPEQGVVLARELLPESYFSFVGAVTLVRAFDDPETGNSRLELVEATLRR